MKVRELIEMLKNAPPEAEVMAWDPDLEEEMPVTGAATGESWCRLHTDPLFKEAGKELEAWAEADKSLPWDKAPKRDD